MVERTLHTANIVACVAAAAGNAFAGGAVTLISGALSGTALWNSLSQNERTRAQKMADAFDRHLAHTHLTSDQRKITAQVFARFPPDITDMAQGDFSSEIIADAMQRKVVETATDPAHRTDQALDDYATALRAILPPLLAPRDPSEAMQQELLRRTQVSGAAQRLQEAGVTEKALLGLAQRLAGSIEDVDQAWTELQNLVEIHLRLQREGHTPSNQGDFVDEVLRRVADLAAEGDYAGAGEAIATAPAEEEARRARLLDSGAEIAMLAGDAVTAADYLIRKADLEAGRVAAFDDLLALQDSYHFKGRDTGTALDLEIAIALTRCIHARANTADARCTALNDLASSLGILGKRESNPARLEEALTALRATLEEMTRDRAPFAWAMTQINLGNALATLGERVSDPARLEEAVAAYRAALEELTRERVPLDWATAQMNLGTALQTLGKGEGRTARLEQAVAAYRAALEEQTRERVPLQWAMAQMNLGNALATLGKRESGIVRLQQAVVAYRAALEEWTRDRVPMQWAITQMNLANLEGGFLYKTGDTAHLDRAEGHARAAREVFVAAQASQYVEMIDDTLAAIAVLRGG